MVSAIRVRHVPRLIRVGNLHMATVTEIGPDIYRFSIFAEPFQLQFNHFLVKDDEPLLFHAGLRGMFPELREAVATVLDPGRIRWVGFSHFESDECGSLNNWLEIAPAAQPVCSDLAAMVSFRIQGGFRPGRAEHSRRRQGFDVESPESQPLTTLARPPGIPGRWVNHHQHGRWN